MNSSAFELGHGVRWISLPHIESLKWVAAIAMLQEHFYRYVVGALPDWSYALGRLTFPLFCLSLGAALASSSRELVTRRVLIRLAGWFVVASILGLTVDRSLPLNVLGTLALCVVCREAVRSHAWWIVAACCVAAVGFDFGPVGLVGGVLLMEAAEQRGRFIELALGLLFICYASASWGSLLALLVVALVQGLDLQTPRVRHLFYWIYAFQFPAFAALKAVT